MIERYYYCPGCLEMVSEERFNGGRSHCDRKGCHFCGKEYVPMKYCTSCHEYYPPDRIHFHRLPGRVHYHAANRIAGVKANG